MSDWTTVILPEPKPGFSAEINANYETVKKAVDALNKRRADIDALEPESDNLSDSISRGCLNDQVVAAIEIEVGLREGTLGEYLNQYAAELRQATTRAHQALEAKKVELAETLKTLGWPMDELAIASATKSAILSHPSVKTLQLESIASHTAPIPQNQQAIAGAQNRLSAYRGKMATV